MRLWHKDLIPVLPRQQLLGQWRECCCIARRVYYNSSCGTFVLIKGYKIFAYDFFTEDTFKLEV